MEGWRRLWLDFNLCLACPWGLALPDATALAWSWVSCCTNFDLGFGFALRFGATLNCVLGFDFGFGSGFAPRAIAFGLRSCKRKTIHQCNNFTTYSSVDDKGRLYRDYCPTTVPLARCLQTRTFFQTHNDCNLCRHDRAATVWVTLTCNCPLTGQSGDNPSQDA